MTNTLVSLQHARKSFGDTEVLKDISLTVEKGEVLAIIGPSGGGKSTLLRCCTLLETLDGGELSFGDCIVTTDVGGRAIYGGKDVLRQARTHFGLVFQNFNLFPHFSVLRNITEAPMTVLGTPREEAEATARKLLAKMGLSEKESEYPYQLSGGQQQRVSIARAMALHPEILFFDEPTSALDPELVGEILKVIRSLAEENMTMVIVTHEMAFARDVADQIIFMDHGKVIESGSPDEIFVNPKEERTRQFLSKLLNP